jgi:hypothetical protein
MSAKPDRGYAIDGSRPTGRFRIRISFFFGWPIFEELIEHRDGSARWKRCDWMTEIPITKETTAA